MHTPPQKHLVVPWMPFLLSWTATLLGAGGVLAQAGAVQPLSGDESLRAQQISFERQEGRVVQVRWGKHEIPMVPPAANLACGLSGDGEHLVLLANGGRICSIAASCFGFDAWTARSAGVRPSCGVHSRANGRCSSEPYWMRLVAR